MHGHPALVGYKSGPVEDLRTLLHSQDRILMTGPVNAGVETLTPSLTERGEYKSGQLSRLMDRTSFRDVSYFFDG